ncbi:hypothetical protein J437_LFUL013076 [Ladona fulva]|uniref:Uncharacterized protein n=1 Tax=Ladona fulva TaxID=123851 RepID=A0A8K0P469_LADFU|nr:hypothetical protein J437_LFUL013076 [Ladona fulva]
MLGMTAPKLKTAKGKLNAHLYHPVLPYCFMGKLTFPLSQSCLDDNVQVNCPREEEEKRVLEGRSNPNHVLTAEVVSEVGLYDGLSRKHISRPRDSQLVHRHRLKPIHGMEEAPLSPPHRRETPETPPPADPPPPLTPTGAESAKYSPDLGRLPPIFFASDILPYHLFLPLPTSPPPQHPSAPFQPPLPVRNLIRPQPLRSSDDVEGILRRISMVVVFSPRLDQDLK